MNVKVNDIVRFLNDVGGGRVTRIDGKTVYVEDEDGFERPAMERELVVERVHPHRDECGVDPRALCVGLYRLLLVQDGPPQTHQRRTRPYGREVLMSC